MKILRLALVVLVLVLAIACGPPSSSRAPEPPECGYPSLAAINAEYVAEGVSACKGKTRQTCAAMPAIEKKYSDKREAWIRCRR